MRTSYRFALAPVAAILLFVQPIIRQVTAGVQDQTETLTRRGSGSVGSQEDAARSFPGMKLDQAASFARVSNRILRNAPPLGPEFRSTSRQSARTREGQFWTERARIVTPQSTSACLGTGSGDVLEVEPNDIVAQDVCLPVNIGGAINPFGDVDFFAFQAFAGEQINIETFASRIAGSNLIADTALFDVSGNMLAESAGDGFNDPLIQLSVTQDQVLIAGITDIDGL